MATKADTVGAKLFLMFYNSLDFKTRNEVGQYLIDFFIALVKDVQKKK